MFLDVGLSIGAIWGLSFILGNYCSGLSDRGIPKSYLIIVAAIGTLIMLAFGALFVFLGTIF